jgi:predicted DNA-binding transcriptional regulator YafY
LERGIGGDMDFERSRGNTRSRLRDDCVAIFCLLREHRRISIDDLASEQGISKASAYRWMTAFSMKFPIQIEDGMIILDDSAIF